MDTFDSFLKNTIQNDKLDFELDNSSFNQLHQAVNLNSTKSTVNKNSAFSFIFDFFNPRFIVAKVVIVAILLIVFIGNNNNKKYNSFNLYCDSTMIQNHSFDTLVNFSNQSCDTLFR